MRQLQRVVNNSRFLVLPWVRVKNLASRLLALLAKRLAADWHARFAIEPLLIETLVDRRRFAGTCYRAANWIELGDTSGRGRMDRAHARHGQAPKRVLVYPLVADAQRRLARRGERWALRSLARPRPLTRPPRGRRSRTSASGRQSGDATDATQ